MRAKTQAPILRAAGISFRVGSRVLLDRIDVHVHAGHLLAIVGPNGAGKSTLLRLLSGEIKPTGGRVELDGLDIAGLKVSELASRRAVVPQASHLGFPFTEVVALGQSVPGMSDILPEVVYEVMASTGILDIADRYYQALSGGERQRVHFARALCQLYSSRCRERHVLLLDEPTSNLDLAHQLQILSIARELAEQGAAVVAVLHDWNLAARFAHLVALLAEGQLVAVGAPADVLVDDLLSAVFKCTVRCNTVPPSGVPYVLPQLCSRITSEVDLQ